MSIATKRGDGGQTSLRSGERVSKNNLRICANGCVDELNSAIGLCRAHARDAKSREEFQDFQLRLVRLMGELATEDHMQADYLGLSLSILTEEDVDALTDAIHAFEAKNGRFDGWLYPGETILHGYCDLARTICRRAEREVVALIESGAVVRPLIPKYLNRLSDRLWTLGKLYSE